MLHLEGNPSKELTRDISKTQLKQVEFNSFSCSGFSHANKVANMHRYLARNGSYDVNEKPFPIDSLPKNYNIESIARLLTSAHLKYGPPRSKLATHTAVLFIVQPFNVSFPAIVVIKDTINTEISLTSPMSDR